MSCICLATALSPHVPGPMHILPPSSRPCCASRSISAYLCEPGFCNPLLCPSSCVLPWLMAMRGEENSLIERISCFRTIDLGKKGALASIILQECSGKLVLVDACSTCAIVRAETPRSPRATQHTDDCTCIVPQMTSLWPTPKTGPERSPVVEFPPFPAGLTGST
ncbi:hypothetical protein BC628DRAFT_333520 [Trametes gibbosa]|nr:hypothetical protein BC628DRAFT_333520 [Trametes gibbosa]